MGEIRRISERSWSASAYLPTHTRIVSRSRLSSVSPSFTSSHHLPDRPNFLAGITRRISFSFLFLFFFFFYHSLRLNCLWETKRFGLPLLCRRPNRRPYKFIPVPGAIESRYYCINICFLFFL